MEGSLIIESRRAVFLSWQREIALCERAPHRAGGINATVRKCATRLAALSIWLTRSRPERLNCPPIAGPGCRHRQTCYFWGINMSVLGKPREQLWKRVSHDALLGAPGSQTISNSVRK